MPPSAITATSEVPPPMSRIIEPTGSAIGRPAPIAAAIGSSIVKASRAPAAIEASTTARFSTPVTPEGTQTTTRGRAKRLERAVPMKWREHLLGQLEVGDHAVFQRPDRGDVGRGAAEHRLGLEADGVDLAAGAVDRDDRGLGADDAAAVDVDQRVGGAEVDGDVATAQREEAKGVHRQTIDR